MIKSNLKLIVAMGTLALGIASTQQAFAQAPGGGGFGGGAGAGGGGFGGGGGAGGAGGAGGGGAGGGRRGGGAPAAPAITLDGIKGAVTGLTDDQTAKITPIVAEITKAQETANKAQADFAALRTANLDKIRAVLTPDQLTAFNALVTPPAGPGGGRRGGGGAPGGGGRRGGGGAPGGPGGGMPGGAAPAPAAPPAA